MDKYWPWRFYEFLGSSVGKGVGGIKSSGPALKLTLQEKGLDLCICKREDMLLVQGIPWCEFFVSM